ncbi:hypothetical protein IYY11_05530 [Methylocystis sp. H62]|uniref:hypothetical protein n=1 Tax=Methylocystis sp. H62 TaxID=2785789 RepID=UPI0018C28868|nr:hypothetical protein [Methylocystis sp. H62]MBG0792865.1 hypothetical protein [Methylocystis sp. H62]
MSRLNFGLAPDIDMNAAEGRRHSKVPEAASQHPAKMAPDNGILHAYKQFRDESLHVIMMGAASIGTDIRNARSGLQLLPGPNAIAYGVDPTIGPPRAAYVPAGGRVAGTLVRTKTTAFTSPAGRP